jgi:hypothetical protein
MDQRFLIFMKDDVVHTLLTPMALPDRDCCGLTWDSVIL